ncbi:MAG: 2-amino-4-hydroxy-6-hydroxymethyldihydropteridine diphosphokinase [Pseudomonadota bacterium]|nr:MAG: 2-amino-4-hydroxy-6-hydroxymethyldihydropteridine diphosphokinase [Pseudomonadota bacterium]
MARIYVSVGSNVEPRQNIRRAVADLRAHYGELLLSSVYESRAVGFDGDNFLNLVVGFDTDEDAHTVVGVLRGIEARCGRERNAARFAPRSLDLDLLLYDRQVLQENGLQLPRGEITEHAFVLCPLAEIAPNLAHPVEGVRFSELWEGFDMPGQSLWPVEFNFE